MKGRQPFDTTVTGLQVGKAGRLGFAAQGFCRRDGYGRSLEEVGV